MEKIKEFTKEHFVEVLGFLGIFLLIIIITYLKMFQKTFTCEMKSTEGSSKIYQKYVVKQSNNKLKSIYYYYKATTPDAKTKRQLSEFYSNIVKNNKEKIFNNDIRLKFDGSKMILSYNLDLNEVKNNDAYKSASSFIKSAKASGFTCK